jgi:hypothetical protein
MYLSNFTMGYPSLKDCHHKLEKHWQAVGTGTRKPPVASVLRNQNENACSTRDLKKDNNV